MVRVPCLRRPDEPVNTAEQLASQARKAREATTRRDELIRQMRAEGASWRTIAAAAGLSHMAVSKIVAKS